MNLDFSPLNAGRPALLLKVAEASVLIALLLSGMPAFAVKISPLPKSRPHEEKAPSATSAPTSSDSSASTPAGSLTGIVVAAPPGRATPPVYRINRPDGTVPAGQPQGWSGFVANETPAELTADAAKAQTMNLLVPPGDYTISFSVPVAELNPQEFAAPMVWTQNAQVRRGKLTRMEIQQPALAPDSVVHLTIKIEKPPVYVNDLLIESADSLRPKATITSQWEYIAPKNWPDQIRIALMKGRYRLTLSRTSFGAFSSYRYELPDKLDVQADTDYTLPQTVYHRIQAKVVDRKGILLSNLPLLFKGSGQTLIMLESGTGLFDHQLPADHYEVRALVYVGDKQREAVLERNLDLTLNQERTWKAPMTALTFDFPHPSK